MHKRGERIKGPRLKFKSGLQRRFIQRLKGASGLSWSALSDLFDVGEHTLKIHFYNEKTTVPQSFVIRALKKYPFDTYSSVIDSSVETFLDENWGQEKAGEIRRKEINYPVESVELAELCGIILGDGHLNSKGLRIVGNAFEKKHHEYAQKLIKDLFGLDATSYFSRDGGTIILNVYSSRLSSFLVRDGLKLGDKIKNGSVFPSWVRKNRLFVYSALRGLFDTDGRIYMKQKKYSRAFIEFQTASPFLQKEIISFLSLAGYTYSKGNNGLNVRIQNQEEVHDFFKTIGSSNPKNIIRYQNFIKTGIVPSYSQTASLIKDFNAPIPFTAA